MNKSAYFLRDNKKRVYGTVCESQNICHLFVSETRQFNASFGCCANDINMKASSLFSISLGFCQIKMHNSCLTFVRFL